MFVFGVALVLRLGLAVALDIAHGGTLFLDDAYYIHAAKQAAAGSLSHWTSYDHWLYARTAGLLAPITALFYVFGATAFLAQAYVAALGSAVAVLTTRIGQEFMPTRWAMGAGLAIAILPSQVLWASVVLKDIPIAAALAAMALSVAIANRSSGRRLAGAMTAAALCVVLLSYLRWQTAEVALIAMLISVLAGRRAGRGLRLGSAAAAVVALPPLLGMGFGGSSVLSEADSLPQRRANNALYAHTAFAGTPAPVQHRAAHAVRAPDVVRIRDSHAVSAEHVRWTSIAGSPDAQLRRHAGGKSDVVALPKLGVRGGAIAAVSRRFRAGVTYRFSVWLETSATDATVALYAGSRLPRSDFVLQHHVRLGNWWTRWVLTWTPHSDRRMAYLALASWTPAGATYLIGHTSIHEQPAPATRAGPAPPSLRSGLGSELVYLPSGLRSVILRPYPWEVMSARSSAVRLAAIESFVWYLLLLLAGLGLPSVRRHASAMLFPLLILVGTWSMYALTEGNVGTAFRHRSECVWALGLLAALGLARVLQAPAAEQRLRRLSRHLGTWRPSP